MTYTVGDVFLGRSGWAENQPFDQPTVQRYDADGVLLQTLTVPAIPAFNNQWTVHSQVVGADGRLYVSYYTKGSPTPAVNRQVHIGIFDGDGNWVGNLATLVDAAYNVLQSSASMLVALPGGDIAVYVIDTLSVLEIQRYQPNGTLVGAWEGPHASALGGFALKPGSSNTAFLARAVGGEAWEINLDDGTATALPGLPFNLLTDEVFVFIVGTPDQVYVVYETFDDPALGDRAWYIQRLNSDLSAVVDSPAHLHTEDAASATQLGLVWNPWDASINQAGSLAYAIPALFDISHAGSVADSNYRTELRRTAVPGGPSVALWTDDPGQSSSIYVYVRLAARRRFVHTQLVRA